MVSINYSAREVCCKIVYYGPGLSGKTTNLQYVHSKVPQNTRGKLISLATEADRTLYFDFLPLNIGSINGLTAKFQLYTVPGQVYYNATRKLVLRGVDGVVFVADSQADKMDDNHESLLNLEENLQEYGYDINTIPVVIQYNKRDLPGVLSVEEMDRQLNTRGWPSFEASATIGNGVFDTLKMVIKEVLDKAKRSGASKGRPTATVAVQPASESQETAPAEESPSTPGVASHETSNSSADTSPGKQPEPEEPPPAPSQPAYRPYPGSERYESGSRPSPQEASEPFVATAERPESTPEKASETESKRSPVDSSPQMAPSMRKRREPRKKRGFFKRLFGIK